jgi:hypothetical protein
MKERAAAKRQPRSVYYTRDQLDELCEQIIVGFCMARYGQELNPIPTGALLQLLEDVDQTADLPDGIKWGHRGLLGPEANRQDRHPADPATLAGDPAANNSMLRMQPCHSARPSLARTGS